MSQLSAFSLGDDTIRENYHLSQNPSSSSSIIPNSSVPSVVLNQAVRDGQLVDNRMADRYYDAPPFDDTVVLRPILTSSKQRVEPDIHAQFHKGFFQVAGTWTCYRRNYFSMSCSFSLWPPEDSHSQLFLQFPDGLEPIMGFYMTISVAGNGTENETRQLWQYIPRKGGRSVRLPERIRLSPNSEPVANGITLSNTAIQQSLSSPYTSSNLSNQTYTSHTFERIQFSKATANNGKRRAQQQYYYLVVELSAEIDRASGSLVRIARKLSAPIVVRGRSPGHYKDERRWDTAASRFPILQPSSQPVESEVLAQRSSLQQEARYESGSYRKEDKNQLVPAADDVSGIKETSNQSKEIDTFDQSSISSVSDIFSLRTMSTNTTFSAPSESMGDLIDLLLTDGGFKALCEDGFSLLGADRFERNFRRLLKIYWRDLLHKASNKAEGQVVKFAKRNLRTITGRIRIITEDRTKANAQGVKKWDGIITFGTSEYQEHQETDFSSEDEIDYEDEAILPEDQYLTSLNAFLMKGDAFEDLREGLMDYVVPFLMAKWENEHSHAQTPSYVMRELQERYQHKRSRRNVVTPQEMDIIHSWTSLASRFIDQVVHRGLSLCRRLGRPALKPGYKRLEWICVRAPYPSIPRYNLKKYSYL
ncbi:hypothetical protein EIK77_002836 [Talaromyces pinophilus]|nr:hypothetical protein EIK77_002836 [Talaromyces pinophilus]